MITTLALAMTYDAWIAIGWVVLGLFFTFMLFRIVKVAEGKPELVDGAGAIGCFLSVGILLCAVMAWLKVGEAFFK